MNKKNLKVAIVGPGFIGKQHYEAIRRLPNTEVVAVVGSDIESIKQFAEEYGIENYFSNYDDLFTLSNLDVIHICTPNYLHHPMAKKALENNIHVFCEKPLALSSKETKDLMETAEERQALHAVNLNYRSNAMVREMKYRVQNEIGDLLLINGQYIQDWLMFINDYDWHFDPKKVGESRTVADIGTHIFDLIQFVTNQNIVKVFADLITVYPIRHKQEKTGDTFNQVYSGDIEEVEVVNEDAAMIICQLEDGTKASINLSQVTGGHKNDLRLTVSGTKKSLTWNQETSDKLFIGNRTEGNQVIYADAKYIDNSLNDFIALPNGHAVGWADAMKNSVQEFYKHIRKEVTSSDSYVDFNKGHQLMKIVEACILSNDEQRWVDVVED